jgi:hypothetical protein
MPENSIAPAIRCPAPVPGPGMQGILRVAVDDANARLTVAFLAPVALPQQNFLLNPLSYSLTGGQRLFPRILKAELHAPSSPPSADDQSVVLTLDTEGDFSIYTLTVGGPDIDPFFSSAKLRFRLACDDRFDCREAAPQPVTQPELPVAIDYLTKDYASFRQALLDFIPTRLPRWSERSEADLGMMLLELFAATADNLSYLQDRVANEAFLSTATQRRSVAGHLALIGYQMDQGASAHTWLQFQVSATQALSGSPGFKVSNHPSASDEPVIVFETLGDAMLNPAHNQMFLYDWGNRNCCLPSTALSAALVGSFDHLRAGDYLLFENADGARDVVRLTAQPRIEVVAAATSPPTFSITVVTWSQATPLHFDHCVATATVRGNLVPATHGETVSEALRSLTDQQKAQINSAGAGGARRIPRQRLELSKAPLAHLDPETLKLAARLQAGSANADFTARSQRSISTLELFVEGAKWREQTSLLGSQAADQVFRVEIDDAGEATVVFGDGTFGRNPPATSTISATYRVGGGSVGNVGADTLTLAHPDSPAPWLISVTNPVAASGGRDLESREHARRVGPATFRRPLVAVSSADYEAAAGAFSQADGRPFIQRANASFRWTGSWLTVTLAADPLGQEGLTPGVRLQLLDYLDTKRLAGYDLEVTGPIYAPIELEIEFCTSAGSQQSDVEQGVLQALSNAVLPGGAKGFFHPDNFSFGGSLFISQLYAAVMAVPGVQSAQITRLARLHAARPDRETSANLAQGFLAVGLDQIIRLDNDRNLPQNGTLAVRAKGSVA